MNKQILSFCMLLLMGSSIAFSQNTDELKKLAESQARMLAEATLKFDFKTVVKHTYPSLVEMMGGADNAISIMDSTFKKMGEEGFEFEKAEVLSVSDVVYEQDQYRCYIQGKNQMRMQDTRIFSESYLLGIYDEEKKIWYFLEAKQLNTSGLKDQILPGFKTEMNIPDDKVTMEEIKD